jgi:hypothetical protein
LILAAIGLDAAIGTNFATVNRVRFHCLLKKILNVQIV